MLEELRYIEQRLNRATDVPAAAMPSDTFSDLLEAFLAINRLIARHKHETPSTGFLEAFTAVLAEIEQERNRWPDLSSEDCLNPTAAYRLGCRRGLRFALQQLEPVHDRLMHLHKGDE